MANRRKAALGIAAVLAALVACAALALHALVDPDRLAGEARAKARAAWDLDLQVGSVRLDVFPRPTLVAQDVVIANPDWAHERDLLRAREVVAKLQLLPLLVGHARVESVAIDGARANLEVREDGAKSWEIGHPPGSAPAHPPAAPAWSTFEQVDVSNTQVSYRRRSGKVDLWRIEKAAATMDPGLRDVRVETTLARNGRAMRANGRFDDLSRLGQAGATTPGEIRLDWGGTKVVAKGTIPLDHDMERATFDATLESRSLDDMLAFFGKRERHTAPIVARAKVTRSPRRVELRAVDVRLGEHRAHGSIAFDLSTTPARFAARLESADLDWGQALLDVGDEKPKPPPAGEMFPVRPLPWGMLAAMKERHGTIDLRFGRLVLPDGIALAEASGRLAIDGDRLVLEPFEAKALGGKVKGTMKLDGSAKSLQASVDADGVLLERWFRERHRPVHFRGGPMKVKASIRATGESMKALAASLTGPVSILMGPGVYDSKIAGDWEARMVNLAQDSKEEIDFECVGAALPFESGRAKGKDIVGAMSRESRLLVSGEVNLREEEVDMKGSVRPKPGQGVGLATIADDIQIAGPLRKMRVRLDPESKPAVIAKGVLAVATAGLSAVATAASNSAGPDPDPCEKVFGKGRPAHP